MKKLMVMVVAAVATGLPAIASTAATFAYQGVLRDEFGNSLSDMTSAKIDFKLYSEPDGGTALWGRKMTLSIGTNGLFNAELSDANGEATVTSTDALADVIAANEKSGKPLYVGLTVAESSGEIRPRQKLLSVPMATYAQNVAEAKGDLNVGGDLQVSGNIGTENGVVTAKGLSVSGSSTSSSSFSTHVDFASGVTIGGDNSSSTNLTVNGPVEIKGNILLGDGCKVLLNGKYESTLPIGTITLWSGSASTLPPGWVICAPRVGNNNVETTVRYRSPYDNVVYTVPDLRGRFVVGANWTSTDGKYAKNKDFSEYTPNVTKGGYESITLSVEQMPEHNHDINKVGGGKSMKGGNDGYYTDFMRSVYKDGWGVDHTTIIANKGGGQAHENRPPYYAMCYIIFIGDNEEK